MLPGGSIEKGENAEQACKREVKEETGLTIEIIRLLTSFKNKGRLEHYFLAKSCGGTLQLGEPEFSRQTEDNQYLLEWTRLDLLDEINLRPGILKFNISEQAGKTDAMPDADVD